MSNTIFIIYNHFIKATDIVIVVAIPRDFHYNLVTTKGGGHGEIHYKFW